MKPKLLVVYLALIILPLVVLGWLGARAISQEREMVDSRVRGLVTEQLRVHDTEISSMLAAWTQEWKQSSWSLQDPTLVRQALRKDGRIDQFFSVDPDGILVYPNDMAQMTAREKEFLVRTESVWASGAIHPNQLEDSDRSSAGFKSLDNKMPGQFSNDGQWYEWFWGDGLQLMYWWPAESGAIYGVEINRVRMLADIIGELPDTPGTVYGDNIGTQLVDESGNSLYQWGDFDYDTTSAMPTVLSLASPLGSWSLRGHIDAFTGSSSGSVLFLGISLVSLALVVAGLGTYFFRENTRELREAGQRVNFVNHVSHELKTPLTNIRMYAELMQDEMEPGQEKAGGRLDVILSESQRLSRLITNVLTFNRKQSKGLTLRPSMVDVDAHLQRVIDNFRKSLEQHTIAIKLDTRVAQDVSIDPDIVEQIVSNLLSNVEKYARQSNEVIVSTSLANGMVEVSVKDNGPGIPLSERAAIFDPFYRIQGDLTEGVSGTGIGLSIARDLAQLHGGDLTLVPAESGAHFKVTLAVQGETP